VTTGEKQEGIYPLKDGMGSPKFQFSRYVS
jgi:hypothetical protein